MVPREVLARRRQKGNQLSEKFYGFAHELYGAVQPNRRTQAVATQCFHAVAVVLMDRYRRVQRKAHRALDDWYALTGSSPSVASYIGNYFLVMQTRIGTDPNDTINRLS